MDESAREHDSGNVPDELISFSRAKYPLCATSPHLRWILEVQQRETYSVERAGDRYPNPVVHDQPAFRCLERRRANADPRRVPPAARPCGEHGLRSRPAAQVRRSREPDVSSMGKGRHRPMEEDELAIDLARQQSSVLVLRRPDEPQPLDAAEVLGGRQGDARPPWAERRVNDHPRIEFGHPGEPGILDSPRLMEDPW